MNSDSDAGGAMHDAAMAISFIYAAVGMVATSRVRSVDEKMTTTNGTSAQSAQVTAIPPTLKGREAYLAEIDGPRPIADDNIVASFRANDVYVAAGSSVDVEVPVWLANSAVTVVKVGVDDEYVEGFDVGFSVLVVSPDGAEKIVEANRRITTIGSEAKPALTFKVEQVPATVRLKLDNAYSWINSKSVLYHVQVEPPIDEEVIARSHRAEVAIATLMVELNKSKKGVSQIQTVRQPIEQKAMEAKKKAEDCRNALEVKVEDFKKSVKLVKVSEQSLKEKELEADNNENLAVQMRDEMNQIQARVEDLRKELQAAELELKSKAQQIQSHEELVSTNKKDVVMMEEDIDNRLNSIEASGAEVKDMEASMREVEEASIDASKELAILVEEEGKVTEHLKFYERLFSDLKLRLLEKPQEV